MPGYEVGIEAMRNAAQGAQAAADELRAVDPASALRAGAAALPGARAVEKIDEVREVWKDRGNALAGEFAHYGDSLSSAAELYLRAEDKAVAHLEAVPSDSGPLRAF